MYACVAECEHRVTIIQINIPLLIDIKYVKINLLCVLYFREYLGNQLVKPDLIFSHLSVEMHTIF